MCLCCRKDQEDQVCYKSIYQFQIFMVGFSPSRCSHAFYSTFSVVVVRVYAADMIMMDCAGAAYVARTNVIHAFFKEIV